MTVRCASMNACRCAMTWVRGTALVTLVLLVGACASSGPSGRATPVARGGGYYLDDGPGKGAPVDLDAIPDAVPRVEPLLARANRPYEVFGKRYVPMTRLEPYRSRGTASWYGRKYHGRQTSSGEIYDMYGMTAAHPTLPLPSYVRVTRLDDGRGVVVRVNDRGPFLNERLIDLSWTAAAKLGFVQAGGAEVEVELLTEPVDKLARAIPPVPSGPVLSTIAAGVSGTGGAVGIAGEASAARPSAVGEAASSGSASVDAPPVVSMARVQVPGADDAQGTQATSAHGAGERLHVEAVAGQSAPRAAAPSVAPVAAGLFLQFGALSSLDGAQAMRERIARELDWIAGRLQVRADSGLFKVDAGPWIGRDEALAVAERVRQASSFRPFPVAR